MTLRLKENKLDLRRQFSNSSPAAESLVNRLFQRVGEAGQVRTDPRFEDARGPNVHELRCVQRRLSPPEVEALVADYQAGGRFAELAAPAEFIARRSRRTSRGAGTARRRFTARSPGPRTGRAYGSDRGMAVPV